MTIQSQVIVIGGGIAGALSSLIFCKAKYKVIWIKNSTEFYGGIQLPPNSIRCLDKLGLKKFINQVANPIGEIRIRSPEKFSDLNTLNVENYFTISRKSLFEILLNSLKNFKSLKIINSSIIHFKKENNYYVLLSDSGERIKANLIIGADGSSGITRKYILGEEKLYNPKRQIHRTIIKVKPNEYSMENSINLWIGNGWHCVIYPIDNQKLNIVLVSSVIPNFKSYNNSILNKLSNANWSISNSINKIDGPTYCFESIALIGDSAHPFPPHIAQGAAQTFEDSISLYSNTLKFGLTNEMLLNYSNERSAKVKSIIEVSDYVGNILNFRDTKSFIRNKLIEFSGPIIKNYLEEIWGL